MENPVTSVHHQRKPTKKSRTKTKPIKVVYISNPMKVKTCASKFRALVQELTGQDAGFPDPTKFIQTVDATSASNRTVQLLDAAETAIVADDDDDDHHAPDEVPPSRHQPQPCDFSFETFEDDFSKLDNFSGLFSSSLFESSQVDVVRSLDAM